MVSLIKDFPPHVVAYTAEGKVNAREYKEVVMKRVDEAARHYRRFNFIVRLKTRFEHYSPGAFIRYVIISFKYYSRWNRMAIVTDERWVRQAYRLLHFLVPGTIRSYALNQFSTAKAWVSEPIHGRRADTGSRAGGILLAGIIATAAMTLFSYALSKRRQRNFKEPLLLSKAIRRSLSSGKAQSLMAGWPLHFLIGIVWAAAYQTIQGRLRLKHGPATGAAFGAAGGLVATPVWAGILKKAGGKKATNSRGFFGHLLLAHLVFGVVLSCVHLGRSNARKMHTGGP